MEKQGIVVWVQDSGQVLWRKHVEIRLNPGGMGLEHTRDERKNTLRQWKTLQGLMANSYHVQAIRGQAEVCSQKDGL